jgi:SnoaL-like domain
MSDTSESVRVLTATLHRYCELFDTGQFDAFASQFEDGRWHRAPPGTAGTRQWIEEFVITYDGSPRTQHITTNLTVDVAADNRSATASSYITVFQGAPGFALQPVFAGIYKDRFEHTSGEWRWLERAVVPLMRGDTSHHVRPH